MRVLIYAPDIHEHDAVGEHCLGMSKLFTGLGYEVKLFSKRYATPITSDITIHYYTDLLKESFEQSIIFFAFSIFDDFLPKLLSLNAKKICYFHNITDPAAFADVSPQMSELCLKGKAQIDKLKNADVIVSNSFFTQGSVSHLNVKKFVVPPLKLDLLSALKDIKERDMGDKIRISYIGRVVPHKNIEMLIEILAELKNFYEMDVVLDVYGDLSSRKYFQKIINIAHDFGVSEIISFYGKVRRSVINDAFVMSDFIITASKHEGFCLPMLEAMYSNRIPLALIGTAAEEVVSDPGLVFSNKRQAAKMIFKLKHNNTLKHRLISSGRKRAEIYLSSGNSNVWSSIVESIC